jgi:sensor histidine kinase YesM
MASTEKSKPIENQVMKTTKRSKVLLQILFLGTGYFILMNIFSEGDPWQKIDYIYTSVFMVTIVIALTINDCILLPRFLNRRKYAYFFLFTAVNITAVTFFNQILFSKLIDYVLPGYYFISYYDYFDLLKFFFVFVGLNVLLHLSWEWFQLQETRRRMVLLEKEKIDAEFKALSNQVNPHFLFNSLNVLYSLALKNSTETPGAIIKLSDILRYVIYQSATGAVSLWSEIELIRNYIDLQRYRIHASARVGFNTDVHDKNITIVPMILLPLVENSFKHGVKGDVENTFVSMKLQAAEGVINFRIANNKSEPEPSMVDGKPPGGIGLKNIEDRLKLMYGDRYKLIVEETSSTFTVDLQLTAAL